MGLQHSHRFTKIKLKSRPYTEEGESRFKQLLLQTDWITTSGPTPTDSANKLQMVLDGYVEECFPQKIRTIRSTDDPWISIGIRKKIRLGKRVFKKEGRSRRWKELKRITDVKIAESKSKYYEKIRKTSKETNDISLYYRVVSALKNHEAPKRWDPRALFPGKTDKEIGLLVADYFNSISEEFSPITEDTIPVARKSGTPFEPLMRHEVSAALKSFKKPKSCVTGDIIPRLVTSFCDILAIPLTDLYNQIIATKQWPDLWKTENVIIIPKCSVPTSLADCRNLSCTPLFSKVMESFLLKRLKKETSFAESQYGGMKGCGADHFLVKTWNEFMEGLEDERACVSLVSVDFEKAFNRMGHKECLGALNDHGASEDSIKLAAAFLMRRGMSVRIGDTHSPRRPILGGCLLYTSPSPRDS